MFPAIAEKTSSHGPVHWLVGNIVAPAVDSGFIEPVNALVEVFDVGMSPLVGDKAIHKLNLLSISDSNSPADTMAQMASTGLAGLIPYMLAGELLGSGMRSVGERFGAEGFTASVLANKSVANVAAAGLYDLARDPYPSESRIGNAIGSMAAFSLYEGLNPRFEAFKPAYRYAAYYGIGAAGGASQYVIARTLAGQNLSAQNLIANALIGGAFNAAMPGTQDATNKVANAIDARLHRGIPLSRFMRAYDLAGRSPTLDGLAKSQPLARVMLDESGMNWIDYSKGVVHSEADPSILGHELDHLQTARGSASQLTMANVKLALSRGEEGQAWSDYRTLRAEQEISARNAEQAISSELSGQLPKPLNIDIDKIASSQAGKGMTYEQVWKQQFDRLRANQGNGMETDFRR